MGARRRQRRIGAKRREHVGAALSTLAAGCFLIWIYPLARTPSVTLVVFFGLVAGFFALRFVMTLVRHRRGRRLLEKVRACGYRVCPECHYSLVGSPDEGCCPECGEAYGLKHLAYIWESEKPREWA